MGIIITTAKFLPQSARGSKLPIRSPWSEDPIPESKPPEGLTLTTEEGKEKSQNIP